MSIDITLLRRRTKGEVLAHYDGRIGAYRLMLKTMVNLTQKQREWIETNIELTQGLKKLEEEKT